MKKIFSLLLVIILILSLCACVGNSKMHLSETASTDIVDFSIDDAKFTVYANKTSDDTYLTPTNLAPTFDNPAYAAPTGKTIVVFSFTIKNKDRAATMCIAGNNYENISPDDIPFRLDWKVKYKGKLYDLGAVEKRFELTNGFDMSTSVHIDRDTQKVIDYYHGVNELLHPGETESYRIAGIVDFEPKSLDDNFEIQASIPDSTGNCTKLTYTTKPAK